MVSPKAKHSHERKHSGQFSLVGEQYSRSKRKGSGLLKSNWHYLFFVALFAAVVFASRKIYFFVSERPEFPSFIKFSAYRIGSREFAVVGLSPLSYHWRTKYQQCFWVSRDDPQIVGRVEVHFPGEHHDLKFEAAILNCLLRHETPQRQEGRLYFVIDGKKILMYKEIRNAFLSTLEPAPPFKHHVTYCSPPVHSAVHAKRLYEWLEYHFYVGIDHAIIYDAGGISEEVLETLLPYEQQSLLEVRDSTSVLQYETWLYAQVMLINDCAYSTRHTSRWTIFMDFDEFFNADKPPLPSVQKAAIELKQEELSAQAHWQRQLARIHEREHHDKVSRLGRKQEEVAHEKKRKLSDRKERTEEEKSAIARAQKMQHTLYNSLKTKKRKSSTRVLSVIEKKAALTELARERARQIELLKIHREHLQKRKESIKLIPLVLDAYENASYITFGSLWWDIQRCIFDVEAKGSWAMQRMLFHWPHYYCTNLESFPRAESCLDYHGHRKYAIDPRKVEALQIHQPFLNETIGIHLDTTVAKINHFQGLIKVDAETCKSVVGQDKPIVWWGRGQELSDIAVEAQKKPVAKFAGFEFPGK